MELAAPPKKSHLLFPSNLPLKVEVLSSPPFLKIWLEVQLPPPIAERGGRVHTMYIETSQLICSATYLTTFYIIALWGFNPLSANSTTCLSVFDHFVGLTLKGLINELTQFHLPHFL